MAIETFTVSIILDSLSFKAYKSKSMALRLQPPYILQLKETGISILVGTPEVNPRHNEEGISDE